jgi:uncharacterized protein
MPPLLINLRHLERHELALDGELTAEDLEMTGFDELMHLNRPLAYELTAARLEDGLLVQGRLWLELDCECGRCLKPFRQEFELAEWACHLPLAGEESVPINNDCVDLTPYVREDILLELPQRPLCKPDCTGLPKTKAGKPDKNALSGQSEAEKTAWAELNKLKF